MLSQHLFYQFLIGKQIDFKYKNIFWFVTATGTDTRKVISFFFYLRSWITISESIIVISHKHFHYYNIRYLIMNIHVLVYLFRIRFFFFFRNTHSEVTTKNVFVSHSENFDNKLCWRNLFVIYFRLISKLGLWFVITNR